MSLLFSYFLFVELFHFRLIRWYFFHLHSTQTTLIWRPNDHLNANALAFWIFFSSSEPERESLLTAAIIENTQMSWESKMHTQTTSNIYSPFDSLIIIHSSFDSLSIPGLLNKGHRSNKRDENQIWNNWLEPNLKQFTRKFRVKTTVKQKKMFIFTKTLLFDLLWGSFHFNNFSSQFTFGLENAMNV